MQKQIVRPNFLPMKGMNLKKIMNFFYAGMELHAKFQVPNTFPSIISGKGDFELKAATCENMKISHFSDSNHFLINFTRI